MNPTRWRQIETLFHRCRPLAASSREDLLAEACDGDQDLRDRVEAMLGSDDTEGWLRDAVGDALPPEGAARKRIGPYRVLGELGRGGMGVVLLGERSDDTFRMRVAIKLVEGRLPGSEVERRLRKERQILARLDHPNIARLLDGGTTADGIPYFVMEYVEGELLDEYCASHRLSLTQRLKLFNTLCGAVHYAHQRLVIHRDLKPSNVMVTEEGMPKLLDFGVAKWLIEDPDLAHQGMTETGARLLTPDYASPEQVRGEPLTTASDVYALGVLLFRLLTGRAPYQFADRRPAEIERVIGSVAAPAPSTVVRETGPDTPPGSPRELSRRLVGDLDTIVLTALRKDPSRRYASVEQLADDVRRHMASQPVRARPDTLRYRARKFVRRHRLAVAVSASMGLVLVAATTMTAWQAQIAIEQRRHAEAESAKATSALGLLVDVFEVSDPGIALGRELSAREILDEGAKRVLAPLDDQAAVKLTLLRTIGRVYQNLGSYGDAARLFGEALEVDRGAESLADLGAAHFELGRLTEAQDLFKEAITLYREESQTGQTSQPDALAEALNDLAVVTFGLGDFPRAETLLRQSLRIMAQHQGLADVRLAEVFENLGVVRQVRDDLEAAERLLRRAMGSYRMALGDTHPRVAGALTSLAGVLYQRHALDDATDLYREALAMRRALLEPDHPDVVSSLISLGSVLRDAGHTDEAESLLRQAVDLGRTAGPAGRLDLAYSLGHLADVLRQEPHDRAARGEAEQLYRESLAIRQDLLDPSHHVIANSLMGLARVMHLDGRCSTAVPLLERAIEIRRAALGEEHSATRDSRTVLADCSPGQAPTGRPEP